MRLLMGMILCLALAATAAAETPLEAGRRLMGEGRNAEAAVALRRAAEAEPANAAIWNTLGAALNRAEAYDEALVAAETAVRLDPASVAHRLNRGLVYWEVGRFAEGEADLDYAVSQRPKLALALAERGTARAALGRFNEARTDWAQALVVDPDYIWARYYRGLAAFVEGDFEAAAADFDAVTAKEDLFHVHLWRWAAHRRAGRPAPPLPAPPEGWPTPIARHLNGEINAAALLAGARAARLNIDDRRTAQALFFIGQKHLADGRGAQARVAFRQSMAVRAPKHTEKAASERELQRLN